MAGDRGHPRGSEAELRSQPGLGSAMARVVGEVNLEVREGEFVCIVGPSGG